MRGDVKRRSGLEADLRTFKVIKNYVTLLMNRARGSFYTTLIDEKSNDQGIRFRAAKKLLVKKDELLFPNYHDNSVLANDNRRILYTQDH